MGGDGRVVNAARVSFAKEIDESILNGPDERLIAYLGKHNHWAPFAHVVLTFRIKAPIFVARQLYKHKIGLVESEISRRYVDYEPEFYMPKTWRGKPENKKQGSSGEVGGQDELDSSVAYFCEKALKLYTSMINAGVAPEQARMILPVNIMTEWYWTGSLVAFSRVCNLRDSDDAQQESRDVALEIAKYASNVAPLSWKALTNGN
jgi:thymidylate synthase (FAD)